jgi:hypothetical protein
MMDIKGEVLKLKTYSQELDLDLEREEDRFKWFLASILFAKRISSEVAKKTYQEFEKQGIVTPDSILDAGWDKLVEVLDSGGYVRYDFSTASNLLEIADSLKEKYGSLEGLYTQAEDSMDLEKRLLEFKGVGPTTLNIFLRELRPVWEKARPQISPLAKEAASRLGIGEKEVELPTTESALVRLNLEFCKRRRCSSCPVREGCRGERKPCSQD